MRSTVKRQKLVAALQRFYVKMMMAIVGRALIATSRVDEEVRKEFSGLPGGYHLQMMVPGGPGFMIQIRSDGSLALVRSQGIKPDLNIKFKHMSLAFLVFSFQEGTARAFANDRIIVDGELSHAIRFVRCMNKMESLILPRMIARLAVKRYPTLSFWEKVSKATRIYGLAARHFILGS